ncbi:TPA: thermosome subunit, partial [Candidatus Bathyarchaeota archaeon]|nr:thermosome subunit [Candidatus Bathyarchaeota archaeon]
VDEAERSLHDALSVVKDVVLEPKIISGGGAAEAEMALRLRRYAEGLTGKRKLAVEYFAESLESIPAILSENAGLDPIEVTSELLAHHARGEVNAGIDLTSGNIVDMAELGIIEPVLVKKQVIKSAAETASMLLKIDDVIAAARMKPPKKPPGMPEEGMEGYGGGGGGPEF